MLERWWCTWLLETTMTGRVDRCRKMTVVMCRGADGGCGVGVEEKSWPIHTTVSTKSLTEKPLNLEKITPIAIDFFSQAKKVLSQRSPFGSEDAQASYVVATLPSGLASQLARHLDGRKRLKKLHLGSEKKASRPSGPEKARGSNVWVETDEYFRELTEDDIDKLYEVSDLGFSDNAKCFEIPLLGDENGFQDNLCNVDVVEDQSGVNGNGVGLDSGVVVKEEVKEENEQFMEVDSVGANELVQEEKGSSSLSQPLTSCSGLEWLLGSRSKIYLTSERPNKKRKLLGGDAGLEKIPVASPTAGSSSLCHYCSLGDTGDQLNRLVVCSSCGTGVHERCYGVQGFMDVSWLCSWCKQRSEVLSSDKPCVLCPKQGGALKPVPKRGFGGQSGMPEVYIEDTRTMEPILNVEGMKGTRKKIICSLCKVKWGACVCCSNGDPAKLSNSPFLFEGGQADEAAISDRNDTMKSELGNPICSVNTNHIPDFTKSVASCSFYVHPLIHTKLTQMQNAVLSKSTNYEYDGPRDRESLEASSSSGIYCRHQNQHCTSIDLIHLAHVIKARNMGILEMSSIDEVEGELIFYQHKLLCNAVARKRFSDALICKVVKSLPQEIDAEGNRKWNAVLFNQYLYELREAKKQGRKERRHKEAHAMLAAATAAAAASSRISSVRKDTIEESAHLENPLKMNTSNGRPSLYSQHMPRSKETLPRLVFSRVSVEKNSELVQLTMDFYKEHPRTCEVCRRLETILNPILVCSGCKVAVHLDCYRSVNNSAGPWYCELCEGLLSSRSSGAPALNSWEKPYFVAECGLCGGTAGAFRKSIDGQWIHAFCAEWVLDSTFRRGQVHPIEGMETVFKGCDFCLICHHKQGVCIKCNYGHCHSMFHPSCARSAGFYMYVRNGGGKMQHKVYCEKHSLEQRAKAENQKMELKN